MWEKNVPAAARAEWFAECEAGSWGNPQSVPMESDGALILLLRTRVRAGFPVEQNPKAQELEVRESFWGAQAQAEGIRWTRLL